MDDWMENSAFFCHELPLSAICSQFSTCFCYCIGFIYSFHHISLVWSIIQITRVLLSVNDTMYMYIFPDYVLGLGLYFVSRLLYRAFCLSSYFICVFSFLYFYRILLSKPSCTCILVSAHFLVSFRFLCLRDLFFSLITA